MVSWFLRPIRFRQKNTNQQNDPAWSQAKSYLVLGALITSFSWLAGLAAVKAQTVVQSYPTNGNVQIGMIVALVSGQPASVRPVTDTNLAGMFGVVISPTDTSAVLSPSSPSSGAVAYVANDGNYAVIVSNQNGPIKTGDYITASSLDGIGMKAGGTQTLVLGKALEGFSGTSDVINTATLTNSAGKKITVNLTEIPVAINVAHNPQLNLAPDLPGFLKHLAQTVTNRPIDAAKAYISLGVLAVTVIVVGIMLYSGVRSSIISIGRNPLSRRSIMRGLIGVSLTSLAIFIIGIFAVYLLLKL